MAAPASRCGGACRAWLESSRKALVSFDPGIVLKTGTTLVRQWRGHTHTVLVREGGFEYEGQRYRSLTVIAEQITGAHWSGPRFFGVTRRARTSLSSRPADDKASDQQTRRNGTVRCAIYTRKSSEEGLEQEFNSLQAQREACEAFITSQRHEGWVCLPKAYDDGGFSGATIDRPALQQLLADLTAGRVDIVVVYKIDRLTRSLADFAKIVEILDAKGASFVSVTQQFNTTTSMGRLTLNVLLSFAQFEREVIGERIRDKIAASKKKGMWMGGVPPLGYRARGPQARHRRRRGGNRALHFSPLCRTRLGAVVEGRTGSPEHPEQVADERLGPHLGWQAIRARCALPDAAEPHLSGRDRSQRRILSWRT